MSISLPSKSVIRLFSFSFKSLIYIQYSFGYPPTNCILGIVIWPGLFINKQGPPKYFVSVNTCPLYLSNNLAHKNGYVTGAGLVNSASGIRGYWLLNGVAPNNGLIIHDDGNINSKTTSDAAYAGIRPVITVDSSKLG